MLDKTRYNLAGGGGAGGSRKEETISELLDGLDDKKQKRDKKAKSGEDNVQVNDNKVRTLV